MNARGPAVCRDRKRIGLLNQKSWGKIFFGGSRLPSDMEKRFSLFWFPRLFPEHSSAFTSQTQLSSDVLLEISCYSPDRLEKCSNETPYRWFQLRVLTRGAICPSSPPKPQKMFLFRLPHINILWGGGGGGFCELTAFLLGFLSFLIFLCLWKSRFMSKHQPRALATPCAHHLVPIKHKTPSLRLQSSTH